MIFGAEAGKRVLPGHPMTGKEFSGVEHADAELFRGAVWLITPIVADQRYTPLQAEYTALLTAIGARIIVLDSMWRDIALTNSENIEDVMLRFEQQMMHLRESLKGPGLREMFESANKFGRDW